MPHPAIDKLKTINVLTTETRYSLSDREVGAVTFNEPLPEQYAVAGWIRWLKFKPIDNYHLVFRLSQNSHFNEDIEFGDHAISLFLSTDENIYTSATYNLPLDPLTRFKLDKTNKNNEWHYVYFSYSHIHNEMISFVWFQKFTVLKEHRSIVHNLPKTLQLHLGLDGVFPNFNGFMHYFKLLIGPGSFVLNPDELDDIFGFTSGFTYLLP